MDNKQEKEFVFNDCNVCINPDVIAIQNSCQRFMSIDIRTAQRDGKWSYGYSFSEDKNGGCCSPCVIGNPPRDFDKLFDTKNDAIFAALNDANDYLKRIRKNGDTGKAMQAFIEYVRDSVLQLSLF